MSAEVWVKEDQPEHDKLECMSCHFIFWGTTKTDECSKCGHQVLESVDPDDSELDPSDFVKNLEGQYD